MCTVNSSPSVDNWEALQVTSYYMHLMPVAEVSLYHRQTKGDLWLCGLGSCASNGYIKWELKKRCLSIVIDNSLYLWNIISKTTYFITSLHI